MTIEEILAGESKNVEFKENLPEKSIKYMKSVVAFANGTGGKIIFGIADKSREVVGFDKEEVFKIMDAIANAVADNCEPAIIPDITLQTVDGKTVIVVEVSEGRQRPYYIKALGRESGVYVRVAGTTRLADAYMVKELLFEGSNRYYDQALCPGLNITDEDIDALCKAMKEQAVRNAHNEEQKASIKDIGRQQLRSWGVLIERDGKDYPSNAFAILTGSGGLHVATQCGVFKGTTKAVFVDRREYTGPLWEQIDEAFRFVLRNIHLGATIVGIYRQDIYDKVKAAGLREPEFIGGEVDLCINIYRGQVDTNNATINAQNAISGVLGVNSNESGTNGVEVPFNKEQMQLEKLLQIIEKNPSATQAYYAEEMGISKRTVSRMFASLQEKGRLVQNGTKRKSNWKIIR